MRPCPTPGDVAQSPVWTPGSPQLSPASLRSSLQSLSTGVTGKCHARAARRREREPAGQEGQNTNTGVTSPSRAQLLRDTRWVACSRGCLCHRVACLGSRESMCLPASRLKPLPGQILAHGVLPSLLLVSLSTLWGSLGPDQVRSLRSSEPRSGERCQSLHRYQSCHHSLWWEQ